jgi:hypothetical protein
MTYLKITTPNYLESASLPSKPLTPAVTPRGNAKSKEKREHRRGFNKTRQTANSNSSSYISDGARLNPGNGGEGKGSRDDIYDITTHNMLIKGDKIDTDVDSEPQIAPT